MFARAAPCPLAGQGGCAVHVPLPERPDAAEPHGPPQPSSPAAPVVDVYKLRRDGSLRIHYRGELVEAGPRGWVVRSWWAGSGWRGPFATMHPGDPCLEFYRPQGRAVVLQLMDADGRLKGFYVDLAAPIRVVPDPPAVCYRDLVLDVFVTPDGALHLLDAEEFLEWVRAGAGPEEVADAVGGLQELLERWQAGERPFDRWGPPSPFS